MARLRISLRVKLALVALLLLALPWAGYEYVREMERFLLDGQEQALLATARAIATALHDRPGLMAPRAEREADPRVRAEEELARIAAQRGDSGQTKPDPAPQPGDASAPAPAAQRPSTIIARESSPRDEPREVADILRGVQHTTSRVWVVSRDLRVHTDTIQWLFWQMGNLGPMAGQNNHFSNYAQEKIPYAMDRYRNEVNRLYGVLNRQLADRSFVAGDYSIADMAIYPWIVPYERQGQKLEDFPHLKRWFEAIRARPAVERAYAKAKAVNPSAGGIRTAEERAILFGQTAASVERAAAQAR